MTAKGRVLRIERSSSYDGDGLRTVVFFKGCPLHCIWCSTPESQNIFPETGCIRGKCLRCGTCIRTCPQKALSADKDGFPHRTGDCNSCGLCVRNCPAYAFCLYGKEMTSDDVVAEIVKDEPFYFQSGGGFTLSGGEALSQPEFALDIFKKCAHLGINGTFETCCYVPWENIEPLLPYLPVIFIDLKHMDDAEHLRLTGCGNKLIHENIKKIDSAGTTKIVIRIPFIPTVNDSDKNLREMMSFCSGLKNLREVELLAYHRLGAETYRRMGLEPPLPDIQAPTGQQILAKAQMMKLADESITVKINGQEI